MSSSWPLPPAELALSEGEVHVWCASLEPSEDLLRQCAGVLSADERQRAERFRTGALRDHYIAGRGTLRLLLGRYLGAVPQAVDFNYQGHGKPELAAAWSSSGLEFNLSHSHGIAIYAFTRGSKIGVDVEAIRPMANAGELMERFFSPLEVAAWRRIPAEERLQAFFQGWTRKEAWLKAVGSGLSFPLSEFCVTLDDPPRIVSIRGSSAEAAHWWLGSLDPWAGYVAAVALRGAAPRVRRWQFTHTGPKR